MKDVMARLMLNEPRTDHEQTLYGTVLNLCADGETVDGLYVLIGAINYKATQRGLNLKLDLSRPQKKIRRVSPLEVEIPTREGFTSASFIRPETAPFLVSQEPQMGWIENALRKNLPVQSSAVHVVYAGARAELRRRGMKKPEDIDIMSEAIEAAGALGL